MKQLVVITGCSGGGKSTLIAELKKQGYWTVPERIEFILVKLKVMESRYEK